MVFAEEISPNCKFVMEDLTKYPHSRTSLCEIQQYCVEESWPSHYDEKITLENDYILKQFLHVHKDVSFEDIVINTVNNPYSTDTWYIPDFIFYHYEGPQLIVSFDRCGYITEYGYSPNRDEVAWISSDYPSSDDHNLANIKTYEDDNYSVIKAIMQRHPTPAIQMSEFNISLNEVHCNGELELYIRDNNTPVCLKPNTYEKLLERGFNLQ